MDLWLKFYPKDWNGDSKLRMCSLAARGLWAAFLEPMHMATPYGHLLLNGSEPPSFTDLATLASCRPREVEYCLKELIDRGVASVTETGIVFSRRMVRDAERLQKRRKDGAKGGHPKLVGGKPEVNLLVNHEVNQRLVPIASSSLVSGISASSPEKQRSEKSESRDLQWEQFKAAYPAKGREQGYMALQFFLKGCDDVGFEAVMAGVRRYAASKNVRDNYVLGMGKWLEKGLWIQEPEPADKTTGDVAAMAEHLARMDAEKAARGR